MSSLTGQWKLAADTKNIGRDDRWYASIRPNAKNAPVPGIVQQTFPETYGVYWYWRQFGPDRAITSHERCLLRFAAVDYLADVYVNGRHVGSHEGGETPFTIDVTDALRADTSNLLTIRVLVPGDEPIDGITLHQIPRRNREHMHFCPGRGINTGGIWGKVDLLIVPAVYITDVFVRPNPHTGDIRTTVTVLNATNRDVRGILTASTGESPGGEIIHTVGTAAAFPPGRTQHELTLHVNQPKLWDLNDPNLYRVTTVLADDQSLYRHESGVRCGFRELRVERGYFRLNGKRIFFKSTHTGNHFPIGVCTPVDPDLLRRDMLMAKVAGYNCVRFIAGMGIPEQMDFADEIGMMVYEENLASWLLPNTTDAVRHFNNATREMVLRDRNHPSITIWGLLNETPGGPIFDAAVNSLSWLRDLDGTRLVLLSSGRGEGRFDIGSLSNPGTREWECQWGAEDPKNKMFAKGTIEYMGSGLDLGDVHIYPVFPHTPSMQKLLGTLGHNTKPVFLTEYGIGSLLDVVRGSRFFEQQNARADLIDVRWFCEMAERLETDWKKWKFDNTYAFLGDMLRDSQRLQSRQRRLAFDRIRANPKICGYNLTGMLDHGLTGEGVWTFFREWKPESAEVLQNGWASLKWCLFVDSMHGYSGRRFTLRAVLANEDVLGPGDYPCTFKVHGPAGTIWQKSVTLRIPKAKSGADNPLTFQVLNETVTLNGPAGDYEFVAYMEKGGAPFDGCRPFRIAAPLQPQKPKTSITTFGLSPRVAKWLARQGFDCRPLSTKTPLRTREAILVGDDPHIRSRRDEWLSLFERAARGSYVVFASSDLFKRSNAKPFGPITTVYGTRTTAERSFEVNNAPKSEWPIYGCEICGYAQFDIGSGALPKGQYDIVLDFCEATEERIGGRLFSIEINDEKVADNVDLFAEAGGRHLAVQKRFRTLPQDGGIVVKLLGIVGAPSISRVSVFNAAGKLIAQETARRICENQSYRLPLPGNATVTDYFDWLYHKECVAKAHPIFDGLQAKGIMDWDYYEPVISHRFFETHHQPGEVIAAAFAPASMNEIGYAAGLMLAEYPIGKGRFLINTFNVLDNIDAHPAADRLLINMIRHGQTQAHGPLTARPKNFPALVKSISYTSTNGQ